MIISFFKARYPLLLTATNKVSRWVLLMLKRCKNPLSTYRLWLARPLLQAIAANQERFMKDEISLVKIELAEAIARSSHQKYLNLNAILSETYATDQRTLGLQFQPPSSLDHAINLISKLAPILDGYLHRSHDYPLLPLFAYHYKNLWPLICSCVVSQSGLDLKSVNFKDLGLAGLLEALHVFTQGILLENIPNQYLSYVGGLDERALLALFHDLNEEYTSLDRDNIWADILGKSIQYSALQYTKDSDNLQNASLLRSQIIEALEQALEE
jgi:hypothetical protein